MLRELEDASYRYEEESKSEEKWIDMLLSSGSSLGGARPKANVKDTQRNLWIAKFPSRHDEYDAGAREYVVHELATMCLINVPEAELILERSSRPKEDAKELFRRLVFNIAVKNTDDHSRNHGFLFDKEGWRLSPCYDVNPDPEGNHLCLNIRDSCNGLDMEFALETVSCCGLRKDEAKEITESILKIVRVNYVSIAKQTGISESSIKAMSRAFEG